MTADICTSVLFDAPKRMEVYGSDGHALFEDTLGPSGKGRIVTHEGQHAFEVADPTPAKSRTLRPRYAKTATRK